MDYATTDGDVPYPVVRAATGLTYGQILTLYMCIATKEGVESLHILPYTIGSQAINERLKLYSAVKRSRAMLASGQAAT